MDKFPEDLNRQNCNELMETCQNELIRNVRSTFYNSIMSGVNECTQTIVLNFPDKLWEIHRKTIIGELLERFGKIVVLSIGQQNVEKPVTKICDIPKNPTRVTIDFSMGK